MMRTWCMLLLALPCSAEGKRWLCEPLHDLWPGQARYEDWPVVRGGAKPLMLHTEDGIRLEYYPGQNLMAGWNPYNGRIFEGHLYHVPEQVADVSYWRSHFIENPVLPPEELAELNRLHRTAGISAMKAAELLRQLPGSGIPPDVEIYAFWKTHQACKRVSWLRFWPEAVLRSLGGACASAG